MWYGAESRSTCLNLVGSSELEHNVIDFGIVTTYCTWASWLNCLIWGLYCVSKKALQDKSPSVGWECVHHYLGFSDRFAKWTTAITLLVTWSSSFGLQIYTCSLYVSHLLIPTGWSFGQVIAVTVWLPSIIEFAYIEYSKQIFTLIAVPAAC